jgi:hypothetical protein
LSDAAPSWDDLVASESARNGLDFVRGVLALLARHQAHCWLFGGWAEELRGDAPPREHRDVDLLYPAADFELVDELIRERGLREIEAKRLVHKRALILGGIVVEIVLVQRDADGYFTEFGAQRHGWPKDVLSRVGGIPVASEAALAGYRASFEELRGEHLTPGGPEE